MKCGILWVVCFLGVFAVQQAMAGPASPPRDIAVPEMINIPAGSFIMGNPYAWCGSDEHEVTLTRDFYLGTYQVTNQQYLELLQWAYDNGYVSADTNEVRDNLESSNKLLLTPNDEGCEIQFDGAGTFYLRESPSDFAQSAYPEGYDPSNHPVKEVTWFGAAAFCDWLNLYESLPRSYNHSTWHCNEGDPYGAEGYRLPTDAEWEYASQYAGEGRWPWGDEVPDCSRANYYRPEPCVDWSVEVGSLPGAPFIRGTALFEMAGNAWDYCNDWWVCDLDTLPQTDPTGPETGDTRVRHGGSWGSTNDRLQCSYRRYRPPGEGNEFMSLRVARTVPPSQIARVCCLAGAQCAVISSGECFVLGGEWWPDSLDCEGNPCLTPSSVELPPAARAFLFSPSPNPFIQTTQLRYQLAEPADVDIRIYDVTGRPVRHLMTEDDVIGEGSVEWDGRDDRGEPAGAGTYFFRLRSGGEALSRQIVILQ